MLAICAGGLAADALAAGKDQSRLPQDQTMETAQQDQAPDQPEGDPDLMPPEVESQSLSPPGADTGQASPEVESQSLNPPDADTGEAPPEVESQSLNPPGEDTGETPSEDVESLGEIPVITSVELTDDMARRAVDAFASVKDKYQDANLEEFENLQDFVDKAPEGKAFEADIKQHGFPNVTDWNTAITTVGFAYSALSDENDQEILSQIAEIESDTTIAKDMKDRMVSSLKAMIPSDNNKKIVGALAGDPAYEEKLKLLAEEE
jgi:hypothetical protein